MNKVQLIQALRDATDLAKSEDAAVMNFFFNEMAATLKRVNASKLLRRSCLFFQPGKELKERVDRK